MDKEEYNEINKNKINIGIPMNLMINKLILLNAYIILRKKKLEKKFKK